ncbi:heterokaryon incompatibility protein domain-containing protein [Trichoderma sp. SZMC 28014]
MAMKMNDEKPGYEYFALDKEHPHIRLVTLNPGSWFDDIDCTVEAVPFDGQPAYEALSYVWGDPKVRKHIYLNKCDFDVTENLWLAMRRLRHPSTPRVIWIDAICINQTDDDEKSQQVAMTGEIYKSCTNCVIWLGESPESSEKGDEPVTAARACELLGILASDKHFPELPCFSAVEGERTEISENYESHFEALQKLLDLPWWKRIWIIQELVLPRTVKFLYASEELPYEILLGVVEVLKTHASTCCKPHRMSLRAKAFDPLLVIQEQVDPIISTRETWAKNEPISLSQLRKQFYAFQATEKRDLFYGLLGLVTEWYSNQPLQPNYKASLESAITEAVFKCILEPEGTAFLLGERIFRTLQPQTPSNLPSWVPDASFCSVPSQWVMIEQRRLKIYSSFTASGSQRQKDSELVMSENSSLSMQTLAVDKITKVGSVCDALENWTKAADVFRQWMDMLQIGLRDWPEQPPPEGTLMDVFWKTVINNSIEADTAGLSYRRPTTEDYCQLRSLWYFLLDLSPIMLQLLEVSLNLESHDVLLTKALKTVYHILVCLWHRRLFITEKGMVGLAPEDAGINDEIHVVLGSPAPFILRRIEEHSDGADGSSNLPSYMIIGNGYLHNIMNGEALEAGGQGSIKSIVIR